MTRDRSDDRSVEIESQARYYDQNHYPRQGIEPRWQSSRTRRVFWRRLGSAGFHLFNSVTPVDGFVDRVHQ
jgi:hypothetical protein